MDNHSNGLHYMEGCERQQDAVEACSCSCSCSGSVAVDDVLYRVLGVHYMHDV